MRQNFISQKYSVVFDDYTQDHYVCDFERKYKKHWSATKESIMQSLERIANLSGLNLIDVICKSNKGTYIVKFDFKVAKTNISAKTGGNRCILEVCNDILLVYSKDNIKRQEGQETLWWKKCISEEFGLCCC